ncbi:hypothetical protein SAMN04488003_11265 [Loktanella fryxellensis]|uniref:Uncharacterized protein n=1 Tax=Loktanella fryxellensis TaxID=245187 RepID=A0A1H8F6C2_9RHOB|nr:hypothetical protein [Loktanella fryxellensis]SEN27421.1 hypothetical protein SAMN04488003_11265 [Loktanella fryxellensis]
MSHVDDVALDLARLALADATHSGDAGIVDQVGEILGMSSQTLQESYLTSIRVLRAEARARALLDARRSKAP